MKLLLVGYADHPSMRLRLLQHVPRLREHGYSVDTFFLAQGSRVEPLRALPALAKRLRGADVVVVQRILERPINLLLRASSTPVVFDFDDALHLVRAPQALTGSWRRDLRRRAMLRYRALVRGGALHSSRRRVLHDMARLASVVIAGNEWLRDEVAAIAKHVLVIPTTVEVRGDQARAAAEARPLTIGWVGSAGDNFLHLRSIDDVFRLISERYGERVALTVVSSRPYETTAIDARFVPWSLAGEGSAVSEFDVGVMPLTDDPFTLGKCAFKAVLCMSHGVPVVLSPVGANNALVDHGVDGYFASTPEEWVDALSRLLDDVDLRARVGAAGFRKVRESYSTEQSFPRLVAALELAARQPAPRSG